MFELPKLSFEYNALEPHIDAKTMKIHHGKHHAGYTAKLNAAINDTDLENQSIEDILKNLDLENKAVRNNGGGFYNHSLFWKVMSPDGGGNPTGEIAGAIDKAFGSFDNFKDEFSKAALTVFGSGWAWLCKRDDGSLTIVPTFNHENPYMDTVTAKHGKVTPLMVIDVWEHAYYLNYQNKRPDYVEAFWGVVNWEEVERRMNEA